MMPFGLKIAIINRAFRKKLDEKAGAMGLTSVQLRVLGSISRLEAAGERERWLRFALVMKYASFVGFISKGESF